MMFLREFRTPRPTERRLTCGISPNRQALTPCTQHAQEGHAACDKRCGWPTGKPLTCNKKATSRIDFAHLFPNFQEALVAYFPVVINLHASVF